MSITLEGWCTAYALRSRSSTNMLAREDSATCDLTLRRLVKKFPAFQNGVLLSSLRVNCARSKKKNLAISEICVQCSVCLFKSKTVRLKSIKYKVRVPFIGATLVSYLFRSDKALSSYALDANVTHVMSSRNVVTNTDRPEKNSNGSTFFFNLPP
jgi:hypothetical protein